MQAARNIVETGQVTSTRNVAFIEVSPALIFTVTGAGGQDNDEDLVYEACNLDVLNDDTNVVFSTA